MKRTGTAFGLAEPVTHFTTNAGQYQYENTDMIDTPLSRSRAGSNPG